MRLNTMGLMTVLLGKKKLHGLDDTILALKTAFGHPC